MIIGAGSGIMENSILITHPPMSKEVPQINIGKNCTIGRRNIIEVASGSSFYMGDNVRTHNNCAFFGNVRIFSNSILSANIFISSGNHFFKEEPYYLINEQDKINLKKEDTRGISTIIEEDVWLGWGVVVLSGVTIGRGAVIGAQTVVNKNVFPYTVFAGVPGKTVNRRLNFCPPNILIANTDSHLPYFYRGFFHEHKILNESRKCCNSIYVKDECAFFIKKGRNIIIKLNFSFGNDIIRIYLNNISSTWSVSDDEKEILISILNIDDVPENELLKSSDIEVSLKLKLQDFNSKPRGIISITSES